jgi:hypothetical protein
MTDEATTMQVEQNGKLQINWGIFNIPTIIAIATVLWVTSAKQERQDARLDQFDTYIVNRERDRQTRSAEINKMLDTLTVKISPIDNLTYRVTVAEQQIAAGLADVNRRVDRVGDSMQGIRDDFGELTSKIDVLSEQVRAAFPKKADLFDTPPRELRTR